MVMDERIDGFRNFVIGVGCRCCDRQQSDGAGADFHPRLFGTAVFLDFPDAGKQTVRIFDSAQGYSRRAHARDGAQSVLPERHQFLTAFGGAQEFPNGTFFVMLFFVFCIIFAHGGNGRRRFERGKNRSQNKRARAVGGDFRRNVGFGIFLPEFVVQSFDTADESGIFDFRFD